MSRRPSVSGNCELCGHAFSMHNELGYCRSQTVPRGHGLHPGQCACDSTGKYIDIRPDAPPRPSRWDA